MRSPWGREAIQFQEGVETSINGAGVAASVEARTNVGNHGFWRRGTTLLFDICIINLDAGSYLCMTPGKALAKAEKENKYT